MLIKPNTKANDLDIEFIKKAILETENGKEFGSALEERNYEFARVH
jgi:hypothetical protein